MAYQNKNGTFTTKRMRCPVTTKGMTKTFPTVDMAVDWEERATAAIAEGTPLAAITEGVENDRTLRAVCDRLLNEYYSFKTKATARTARGHLNRLCVLLDGQSLISDVLTTKSITRLIHDLRDQGKSVSYLNAFLQYFRKMSTMCVRWGLIPKEVDVPPQFKRERTRFEWRTMEEVERLLLHMPRRYHPVVRFINSTGLRKEEALTITPEDVQGGRVRVLGKGVKVRYVPLSTTALDALAETQDQQEPGKPIFRIRYASLAYAMQVASVRTGMKTTPHTLRHSFASRLAQKGIDIVKLQELMGHADIGQTRRYMHLHPDWMSSVHNMLD